MATDLATAPTDCACSLRSRGYTYIAISLPQQTSLQGGDILHRGELYAVWPAEKPAIHDFILPYDDTMKTHVLILSELPFASELRNGSDDEVIISLFTQPTRPESPINEATYFKGPFARTYNRVLQTLRAIQPL